MSNLRRLWYHVSNLLQFDTYLCLYIAFTYFAAAISPNFSAENVFIRVRRDGVNFDYSMPLLKMSLSGREGDFKAILANVTKFTVYKCVSDIASPTF